MTRIALVAAALFIALAEASSAATESGANKITTVGQVRSFLSSVAIGRDGLPVISFYGKGHLKVLHCGNRACSHGNSSSTVDKQHLVGYSSSITIGADGLPLISYGSNSGAGGARQNQHLKVVHCGNRACSRGNTITVVDKHPAVGYDSSVRIGADKRPVISYLDLAGDLELLRCGNQACTAANTSTKVAASEDWRAFFAIGRDGLPLIAYGNANDRLRVLHCGNRSCTSGNSTANVDDAPHGFGNVEIAIGRDGRPLLSYFWGSELMVLHCGNRTCSSRNTSYLVDRRSPILAAPSLTIGADGVPLVSYVVAPSPRSHQYKLKVLHCGNGSCRPHR